MKKLLFILIAFISLSSSAQSGRHPVNPPYGARVMSDPVTGALTTQAELLHSPVALATTALLAANTYNNGTAGVGATLTENANGALTIDGVAVTTGMRVLIKNEVTQANNGIYIVTQPGDGSHPYILTRGSYSSLPSNLIAGSSVFVQQGTANFNTQYYQQTTGTITVGTTALVYSTLAGLGGSYLAIANNLSEIAGNGPVAVAAAQSNLGIIPLSPVVGATFDTTVNSSFFVLAGGIPRTSNAYVVNDTILWQLVNGAGGHAPDFFDSVGVTVSNNRMQVYYPPVKNIITVLMNVDETIGPASCMSIGASVSLNLADFQASQPTLGDCSMHGDGAGNWVQESSITSFTASAFTVGSGVNGTGITFTSSPAVLDPLYTPAQYQGPNGYTVENVTSGLGSYNKIFRLLTPSGGYLVTNPTTSDHVVMGSTQVIYTPINLAKYTATNGYLASSFANFWIIGIFEAYIVGNAISPTSAQVRFQTKLPLSDGYAAATTYKIYRDVNRHFTSPTLVYSGTAGSFVDAGLTANTVYYYEYVPYNGGTIIPSTGGVGYPWYPIVTNH